jgi:hypothetical protein
MKKILKISSIVVLSSFLAISAFPVNAATDANAYLSKFENLDFQQMMNSSHSQDLNSYLQMYGAKKGDINGKFGTDVNSYNSNIQNSTNKYNANKGVLSSELPSGGQSLKDKFQSMKSNMGSDISSKVNSSESNYTSKDAGNKSAFAGSSSSGASAAKSSYNSSAGGSPSSGVDSSFKSAVDSQVVDYSNAAKQDLTAKDMSSLKSDAKSQFAGEKGYDMSGLADMDAVNNSIKKSQKSLKDGKVTMPNMVKSNELNMALKAPVSYLSDKTAGAVTDLVSSQD